MKHLVAVVLSAAVLSVAEAARAAEPVTEFFDSGLNGWTNGPVPNGWVSSGQNLQLTFPSQKFPLPLFASIEGGPLASGGGFSGDFTATNIECIGFSFLAENVRPSDLHLELASGETFVLQELASRVGSVGQWSHFTCPLVGPGSERWSGFAPATVAGVITNITRIALRVTSNSSTNEQRYRLDDFYVGPLPAVAGLNFAGNETRVTWENLRTNFTYRMEFAHDVSGGSWSNVTQLTATSSVHQLAHTNALPVFYRLVLP